MLERHSDNNNVIDFFQKISNLMMHIEGTGASRYDEYVRNCRSGVYGKGEISVLINIKSEFKFLIGSVYKGSHPLPLHL